MIEARKSRVEIQTRSPNSALMKAPLGLRPQSQRVRMAVSQST